MTVQSKGRHQCHRLHSLGTNLGIQTAQCIRHDAATMWDGLGVSEENVRGLAGREDGRGQQTVIE